MSDQRQAWFEELKADALAVISVIENKGFTFHERQPDGSSRDITSEVLDKQKLNVERMDAIIAKTDSGYTPR